MSVDHETNLDKDEKLRWFLRVLNSVGGQTDGYDASWNWINAFCGDREPQTDTFNIAIALKFISVTHDDDESWIRLTEIGKAALLASSK